MIVVSHPIGNANVRALLDGVLEDDLIEAFITSIATFDNSALGKISDVPGFKELKRRAFNKKLEPLTHTYPSMETARLLSAKLGIKKFIDHESGRFSIDRVCKYIDAKTAAYISTHAIQLKAVYAYEDAAQQSFEAARKSGIKNIYDLPIGYWRSARKLLEPEKERWPEWASTLNGFKDSVLKLSIKDKEIELSDHIVVASTFTANTLKDYPAQLPPVHIVPYGFPQTQEYKTDYNRQSRKLKMLFVGGLSQRKGLAYLFKVADKFKDFIDLTIVGNKATENCAVLDTELKKHRWIPSLPHKDVLALMRQQDLLVFPSLFEGFGLVISEAMSQGIPVLTTERTAGLDLINHSENGWLMEAGNIESFEKMMDEILSDRKMIEACGKAARHTAMQRPWSKYGNDMSMLLKNINE